MNRRSALARITAAVAAIFAPWERKPRAVKESHYVTKNLWEMHPDWRYGRPGLVAGEYLRDGDAVYVRPDGTVYGVGKR